MQTRARLGHGLVVQAVHGGGRVAQSCGQPRAGLDGDGVTPVTFREAVGAR